MRRPAWNPVISAGQKSLRRVDDVSDPANDRAPARPSGARPPMKSARRFDRAVRAVLRGRGEEMIGIGDSPIRGVDVLFAGDVWARARQMNRLGKLLADNRACLFLVDTARPPAVEVPFLARRLSISLGAFRVAA